jgi:Flp pilus assembly protein CpaB
VENLLPKGMLGTPRRTVIAGVAALVLATILLLVYLSHYRNSVKTENASATVLVAKAFIPKGSTADAVAKKNLWEVTPIPKDQLQEGAVTDARVLHGQVALDNVYPGQQLLATDFGVTAISSRLSAADQLVGEGSKKGTWRAMSFGLDGGHGIIPQVQTDDHVDIYAAISGTISLFMQNVLVLAAPNQAATNTTSPVSTNYILRIPSDQAARFAYLSDNGSMWFALRPQKDAKPAKQKIVTGTNLLVDR